MTLTAKQTAKKASIEGFDEVLRNLSNEIQAIQGRSIEGMLAACTFLRHNMETVSPKIPLDTGFLKASWFTETFKQGTDLGVVLGFTANYALWVHEMVDAHFKGDGTGAKFLEAALNRNHDIILEYIRSYAKIQE